MTQTHALLQPDFDARALIGAVLIKAFDDATRKSTLATPRGEEIFKRAFEARVWLKLEGPFYLEAIGLPDVDPTQILRKSGHVRRMIERYRFFWTATSGPRQPRNKE
jgi:hypothetical protein